MAPFPAEDAARIGLHFYAGGLRRFVTRLGLPVAKQVLLAGQADLDRDDRDLLLLAVAPQVDVEVRDEAGNVTTVTTPEAVSIDHVRPQGKILNVRPVGS